MDCAIRWGTRPSIFESLYVKPLTSIVCELLAHVWNFHFSVRGSPYELGRKSQTSDWADFWHIKVFGGAEHESEVHLFISMKVEPFWGRFGWEKAKFPLFGPCIFSTCSNGITVLRGPLLKTCFLQLCFSYNFRYLWGKCR